MRLTSMSIKPFSGARHVFGRLSSALASGGKSLGEGLATREDNFLMLRILAAIAVIYGHSFALSPRPGGRDIFVALGWGAYSGEIAVYMFFAVSGFMVTGSLLRRASVIDYLVARCKRIVPALFACVLVTAVILGPIVSKIPMADYFGGPGPWIYIYKNLRFSSDMSYSLPGVFLANPMRGVVNGSLWTLPAEFHMYLLVAVLGALGMLGAGARYTGGFVVGLIALGLLFPALMPVHIEWLHPALFFLLGMLAQLWKDRIRVSHVGMLALVYMSWASRKAGIYPAVFAISVTYFCFWFAYAIPRLPGQRAGDPSYGIYLWGWPLQQVFAMLAPGAGPLPSFLVCAALAVLVGFLSWRLIEHPVLSYRPGRAGIVPARQTVRR